MSHSLAEEVAVVVLMPLAHLPLWAIPASLGIDARSPLGHFGITSRVHLRLTSCFRWRRPILAIPIDGSLPSMGHSRAATLEPLFLKKWLQTDTHNDCP